MIGAEPDSGWLFGTVRVDKKGFILTGATDGFEKLIGELRDGGPMKGAAIREDHSRQRV